MVGSLRFEPGYLRILASSTEQPAVASTQQSTSATSVTSIADATSTVSSSSKQQLKDSSKESTSQDNVIIIAIAVTSAVVVAVLILVLCLCYHKRQNQMTSDANLKIINASATSHSSFSGKPSKGWLRFDDTTRGKGSMTSLGSGTLPPLPVSAIFGPERRTTGACVCKCSVLLTYVHDQFNVSENAFRQL